MKRFGGRLLKFMSVVFVAFTLCVPPQIQADTGLADFGFSNDREGVIELLGLLVNQDNAKDFYRGIVTELDADNFATREAATLKLSRMPVIDRALLEELSGKASPEAAIRIQRVLKTNSLERFDSMVTAVLDAIIKIKAKGLTELLFKALEARGDYGKGEIWNKSCKAAEVTVVLTDIDYLSTALQSRSDVVRGAAIQAISKVAGERAGDMILPSTGDSSPYVVWEAARHLALLHRHECLKPFAKLLMCDEDFGMRWRSLDALRKLTGERFNYYAAGNREERKGPAAKWMAWIEANAADAELNFGAATKDRRGKLFNGKDLEGWSEFSGLEPQAGGGKIAQARGWQVKGGVLKGNSDVKGGQGELRTDERFLNYDLSLEYRFPEGDGDSGIGIFAGDRGSGYLEVQLHPGNSGDLYRIGGIDIDADNGDQLRFRAMKFQESNERGEDWNNLKIRVIDGAVEVFVNGLLQNRARGGPKAPGGIVLRREIALRSAGIEFRNIILEKL
ncbi:MAG: DUF1080 domain-containing protein [Verrucomicrobiaceae bacterium]|nr:DUF1080 domain-containing protein [Verrucomicrobiaceae bacterium]